MFNKKITYLIIFTGIVILVVMFFNPYSYKFEAFPNITIEDKFYESYQTEVAMREDYKEKCDFENRNSITFPRTKPDKVFLHSNGLIKHKNKLNKKQVNELLTILNDSTNYVWGEIGTPEVHYYFTFHNSKDEIIGVSKIDLEGMIYSEPYIAKMKWGRFDKMRKIHNLINDIKNNPFF